MTRYSALIVAGDKILRLSVVFDNIAFEDALTILSYAAPYPIELQLEKVRTVSRTDGYDMDDVSDVSQKLTEARRESEILTHPMYRSRSVDYLQKRRGNEFIRLTTRQSIGQLANGKRPASISEDDVSPMNNNVEDKTLQLRKWRAQPGNLELSTWDNDSVFRRFSVASTTSDYTEVMGANTHEVVITVHRSATDDTDTILASTEDVTLPVSGRTLSSAVAPSDRDETISLASRRSLQINRPLDQHSVDAQFESTSAKADSVSLASYKSATKLGDIINNDASNKSKINGRYSPSISSLTLTLPAANHSDYVNGEEAAVQLNGNFQSPHGNDNSLSTITLGDYFINANASLLEEMGVSQNELAQEQSGRQTLIVQEHSGRQTPSSTANIQRQQFTRSTSNGRTIGFLTRNDTEVNNNDIDLFHPVQVPPQLQTSNDHLIVNDVIEQPILYSDTTNHYQHNQRVDVNDIIINKKKKQANELKNKENLSPQNDSANVDLQTTKIKSPSNISLPDEISQV